jgi:flagellar protein FliO/FliZ
MKRFILVFIFLAGYAHASETAANPSTASMFQTLLGLTVVLGLLATAAWGMKRLGMVKTPNAGTLKIVSGINVGNREKILVIEVAEQWIVVGVTAGQINTLVTMPRQEIADAFDIVPVTKNFATWLKQTIDHRNGKK